MNSVAKKLRYTLPAQLLHWMVAVLFVALCVIGFRMTRLPEDDLEQIFSLYQLHKSLGISLLVLMVVRMFVRVWVGSPPYGEGELSNRDKRLSRIAHGLLYLLLLLVPMMGWALVSASPYNIPTILFDVISWPPLPPFDSVKDKAAAEGVLKIFHKGAAYSVMLLAAVHILAALRHRFILRDSILSRMLPSFRKED